MLMYQVKLASYNYQETNNLIKNYKNLLTIGEKAIEVGEDIDKVISQTFIDGGDENPVLDFIDTVSDIKEKIGKFVNVSVKTTKFIFG